MTGPTHGVLKGLGGIAQAVRHAQVLEAAKGSGYGHLTDVRGGHRNLMVSAKKVDLGKDVTAVEVQNEILQILDCVTVRFSL